MLELINAGFTDNNLLREVTSAQNARNREIENTAQQNAAGVIPNPLQGDTGLSNKKTTDTTKSDNKKQEKEESNKSGKAATDKSKATGELTEEQKREVAELKATDRKVRQHEMAHLAAAQGIAVSGANFQYKQGPDGVNYAVGGDVQIDTSKDKDPEKTIAKARKIIAAANAPADPSPQDRQVAAQAQAMQAQAQQELARQAQTETTGSTSNTSGKDKTANNAANITAIKNQAHPGIKEYQKNQEYAPSTSSANTTTNTFGLVSQTTKPGITLNLVA